MGRRKRDLVDHACDAWGRTLRETYGLSQPNDYLGAVRCTLAQRRDLHHGSTSGKVEQHWPEVHSDLGWCVSRAYQHMRIELRQVLFVHYVVPGVAKSKIPATGLKDEVYWDRLGRAKQYVDGWLGCVRSELAQWGLNCQ